MTWEVLTLEPLVDLVRGAGVVLLVVLVAAVILRMVLAARWRSAADHDQRPDPSAIPHRPTKLGVATLRTVAESHSDPGLQGTFSLAHVPRSSSNSTPSRRAHPKR